MSISPLKLVVFALLSVGAHAQTIPDAGALMRQAEQNSRFNQPPRGVQKRDALPPPMVFNDTTLITAQRFKFVGNKILTSPQLQQITQSFTNKELNQHDLQMLTETIADAYRLNGWLVQAYIPRQPIDSGELTVQILESIPSSRPAQ
jgi:hemolysin activation/secretion protein